MNLQPYLSRPSIVLTIWSLYHLIVWTLLPLACNTCLPLDCIEAVMWGSEWQWGYDKHPPLSAWAAQLFAMALGDAGVYLLSQLCIISAGLGIYALGKLLKLSTLQSLLAVLLLDTIYFYQFISVEFNVNYLQLPFWAWGWYFGIRGSLQKNPINWIALGVCVGLGALTKYIAVLLLIPLFAAWYRRGELKETLTSYGIYLAGMVSILLFLPHFLWMKSNDWMTLTYGIRRGASDETFFWHHLWHPVEFILSQFGILLPLLLLCFLCRRKNKETTSPRNGAKELCLTAYASIVIISALTGISPVTMWAVPMPLAIGLWLVPASQLERSVKKCLWTVAALSFVFTTAYAVTFGAGPVIRERPHRVNYPGVALVQAVEQTWNERNESPLFIVIADEFLGGIVNHYSPDQPQVMIRANLQRSRTLSDELVSQQGALVLWLKSRKASDPHHAPLSRVYPDLESRFPQLVSLPDLLIPWPRRSDQKIGRYGIAYIPPKKLESAHD